MHKPDAPAGVPGYRIEPLPDPESVGEDEELVAALRDEIGRDGPITFAWFMARALYEPGHGYYRRAEPAPGRGGDFITAPEAHPIFGAALGRLVAQIWGALGRPDELTVTEPGAGTGALAAGLLAGLRDDRSPLLAAIRYRPVEVEPARLETLRARLAAQGLDGLLTDEVPLEPSAEVGVVIANEVLDALPVHRVVGRPTGLRELLVGLDPDGRFTGVEAAPSTQELAARLEREGVALADGQITEICLAVDGWLAGAVRHLARGVVVLIDYAAEPTVLHGPAHPTGTLRAFARHAVGADPFRQGDACTAGVRIDTPGLADEAEQLSSNAFMDVAVEKGGLKVGFMLAGWLRQGHSSSSVAVGPFSWAESMSCHSVTNWWQPRSQKTPT